MRVHYEIYGCAVMRGEAMNVLEELKRRGYEVTEGRGDAAIIFTCTVRSETEQRMLARIESLVKEYKDVIVTGCLSSAQPGLVKKMFPGVKIVSNGRVHEIEKALRGEKYLLGYSRPRDFLRPPESGSLIGIVPIADGCLGNCTFCITKVARPKLFSYSKNSIVNYALKLVERGAKELWITAPDVASYGRDTDSNLAELIGELLERLPDHVTVRIGMMNPDTMLDIFDELIEVYEDPRVYKFFHVPLQSASDRVLKLMGRKYTYDEYRDLVKEIRRKFLDPTIATDILVGFPGEDEDDFDATVKALKELAFERVHVAAYTPRPLTLGARMRQVREDTKSRRVKEIYSVMIEMGKEVHKRYVGGRFKVKVIEIDRKRGTPIGRLHNYVPVVIEDDANIGEEVWVEIQDYTFYDLRGRTLET